MEERTSEHRRLARRNKNEHKTTCRTSHSDVPRIAARTVLPNLGKTVIFPTAPGVLNTVVALRWSFFGARTAPSLVPRFYCNMWFSASNPEIFPRRTTKSLKNAKRIRKREDEVPAEPFLNPFGSIVGVWAISDEYQGVTSTTCWPCRGRFATRPGNAEQ
jgi:hypothetical protein